MNLNFAGKTARFFVENSALSILLLIGIIAFGTFTYIFTPKQYNPTVVMPVFRVQVEYQGATAAEVEQYITLELEERLADIPGVDAIYSRSIDGGISIVTVEFNIGEDLEMAKTRVQSKIAASLNEMQPGMENPLIQPVSPDDVPIVTIGFTSSTLSQNEVRNQIIPIMDKLREIAGVANLEVQGGERRALRIILDPTRMQDRGISPQEIEQAIDANNLHYTVGTIRNEEALQEVTVDGALSVDTLRNLYLKPDVRLQDVAHVIDGYTEKTSYVRVSQRDQQGEPVVFLSIAKRKGESTVAIADTVLTELAHIMQYDEYNQLEYQVYRNDGEVAEEAVLGLGTSLLQSIGIVSLVLLLFLGLRSAILVAFAIPLSLALVFVVGYFAGQTINRITLFALILSLGLLVDSATVVVDNLSRYVKKPLPLSDSIALAVNEVGIGLLLSTVTSVIVFLPTSQISGLMGAYMGPLSFFVPMALLMSLLIAYSMTPFLASLAFRSNQSDPDTEAKPPGSHPIAKLFHWLTAPFRAIAGSFDLLTKLYQSNLRWLLHAKWRQYTFLGLTFLLLVIVLSFPVLKLVHFRMLPGADKRQYYVYIDGPEGTDLGKSLEVADMAVALLLRDPYTQSVQEFIGTAPVIDFNGLYKGAEQRTGRHYITLRVNITPPKQRTMQSGAIVSRMRDYFAQSPAMRVYDASGFTVQFIEDPPGPPVQATLVAKIKGPDPATRRAVARDMMAKMRATEGVVDVQSSIETPYPRTTFVIDYSKANRTGIATANIVDVLQTATDGRNIGQYHLPEHNEFSYITLEYPPEARNQLQDLGRIYVKSQLGHNIPLSELVTPVSGRQTAALIRDERGSTTYVTAELDNRSVVYAVIDLMYDLIGNGYQFPNEGSLESWDLFGLNYLDTQQNAYAIVWGGEWEMTLENFRDLGMAMIVAFILIYAVLIAQFRSFLAPALIMTTIPLGFIGILPGFALLDATWGTFLTATSLIGFIALMGIVVNNAILYLEYYGQSLAEGKTVHESLLGAGEARLRPILLTSATTVLGSLTIANDPVWSGLAWAIVFGLSLSALFTLGVFPLLLNIFRPKLV
ncbi:MAG: efflux RND transporter permease subunit [Anaerolineae bacterium]|nr:efflux RND transporter permease subunit [Anaerolineae bacterium]MCB9107281.1 efflux RND transporter permease subunit [Anaerolineales bacterium]